MIVLEPRIIAALEPAEACILAEALDQLGKMKLEGNARWRVLQIEHCVCEKPNKPQLEEP